MATKITVIRTCDISGEPLGEDGETVKFALDGITYEIDLTGDKARGLRAALAPFIKAGRTAEPAKAGRPRRSGRAASDRERARQIRAWAKKHGLPVSEKGRISKDLIAAFEADDPALREADSPDLAAYAPAEGDDLSTIRRKVRGYLRARGLKAPGGVSHGDVNAWRAFYRIRPAS